MCKIFDIFSIAFHRKQVYQELERQKKRVREDIKILCGLLDGPRVTDNTVDSIIDSMKL